MPALSRSKLSTGSRRGKLQSHDEHHHRTRERGGMTDGWLPIAPVSEDVVDQIMKLGCHPRLCNYPMCKNVFINEGSASCWGRISDRLRAALAAMLPAEPSEDALKFVAVEVRRNRFVR